MYTAIVLTPESQAELRKLPNLPESWVDMCHHMTINMGPAEKGPAAGRVGEHATMKVVSVAKDDLVMAVGVRCDVPSANKVSHVTVAVNRADGGKPFLSNKLVDWVEYDGPYLEGYIQEVS
jgi:hypothetical protein